MLASASAESDKICQAKILSLSLHLKAHNQFSIYETVRLVAIFLSHLNNTHILEVAYD